VVGPGWAKLAAAMGVVRCRRLVLGQATALAHADPCLGGVPTTTTSSLPTARHPLQPQHPEAAGTDHHRGDACQAEQTTRTCPVTEFFVIVAGLSASAPAGPTGIPAFFPAADTWGSHPACRCNERGLSSSRTCRRARPKVVPDRLRHPDRHLSMAKLRWLWRTFRDRPGCGVSCGVLIIIFVVMPGVRS
jgi:hypothetical protein